MLGLEVGRIKIEVIQGGVKHADNATLCAMRYLGAKWGE